MLMKKLQQQFNLVGDFSETSSQLCLSVCLKRERGRVWLFASSNLASIESHMLAHCTILWLFRNCTFPPDFIFVEAPANVCFSSSPAILGYRPFQPDQVTQFLQAPVLVSLGICTYSLPQPPAPVLSHPFLFTWRAPACLLKFSFSHNS